MACLSRRSFPLLLAALVWALAAVPAPACPFCSMQGQTLTNEVSQASMVLYGKLTNPQEKGNGGEGTTDLAIETVVKRPADKEADKKFLGDRKVVTLARLVEVPKNDPTRFLVFCDIFKDRIDPYRGIPVKADSDLAKYLKGAVCVKDEKVGERLRFFFNYLDNADLEVSNDAYKEFANADYKDYRDMARTLPADRVARWLEDARTPEFRIGLYASMLGHCGTEKHAALLRKLLDNPGKRVTSGVDGILAGYTMLKPKEGWEYIRGTLKDPKKEFLQRYAALKAVRFLWEYRPDLVNKKDLADGAALLLDQNDIADLAIEDLRKWQRTDMTGRILDLRAKPAYEIPIVRRAVLRFALSVQDAKETSARDRAAAASYVAEQRKKDAQAVSDAEELLKLEQTSPPSTASSK